MSTTGNEYEKPGVNYSDREDADGATDTPQPGEPTRDDSGSEASTDAASAEREWQDPGAQRPGGGPSTEPSHQAVGIGVEPGTDHLGQDGARETLTASEAQTTPGALGTEQEQRLPAMAQNNASDVDKVAGIVAQTRADIATGTLDEIAHVLRQRFEQSGIDLPDADVQELARQVSTGDAAAPDRP